MYYYDSEAHQMRGSMRDWRKALRAPATYRVGNAVRIQPQFFLLIILIAFFLLLFIYYGIWTNNTYQESSIWQKQHNLYNLTYPLTKPLVSRGIYTYRIGIIADLDTKSKSDHENLWISFLKKGYLSYNPEKKIVEVSWDDEEPKRLASSYSLKGRGMELSELVIFDGRLLTFDDRSGMIFDITDGKVIPWVILTDGNGKVEKGFKSEWATVKDEILYVGSMGKEWTTPEGVFQNYDPMWVKAINMHGEVQHLDWVNQYKSIRSSIGVHWPGYMIHEAAAWSSVKGLWFFLPRRCSFEPYNETRDEVMGCNYLITANEFFRDVKVVKIKSKILPKHGFSSFKFIPGTNDEVIVALRTLEFEGKTQTFIMAFNTDGTVLYEETLVADLKYEGLEFL